MNKMSEAVHRGGYRILTVACAAITILVGLLIMVGWWLHIAALMSIVPGLVTMKPNTALCFILAGIALLLLRAPVGNPTLASTAETWIARFCSVILMMIGIATYGERAFGWHTGIDEILFHQTLLATGVPRPGLMAAATAFSFFLLGVIFLTLDWETTRKRRPAQLLAVMVILIGFVSLLGYLYGVHLLYGASGYSAVAVHTAIILMILGLGTLFARPDCGLMAVMTSDRLGGLMARWMLPFLVVSPVIIGWLRMRGEQMGFYHPAIGSALFSTGYVILLAVVVWISALWLNRADLARRRAEERDVELAAIVDSSSDAIVGTTLSGMITSWNKGAERLYGYNAVEMLGRNINVLLPAGSEELAPVLDEARKGFLVERFVTARQRMDQTLIHVSLTISPVRDREGRLVGASDVARDITQQIEAEEQLSQSQAQLKGIIDSAMDAVITIDQEQKVVMFNSAAEKMFGYTAQEAANLPLEQLMPERFRADHPNKIRNFGTDGITSRAIGTLGALSGLRKGGREFPIEASVSQVQVNGKKFFTAIVRDITERLRADNALREQAGVLNLTQVLVRDMEDRIILWNRGSEKLYGFTLEEALGRVSHDLLQTVFPEPLEDISQKLLSKGEWEGELLHRKRDGSEIAVASVWTLERTGDGKPWRILESSTDITERMRAEEAVQLAQARLLSALEGGRMGTWVWDIAKNNILFDEALDNLFGHSDTELPNGTIEPFIAWVHPLDRDRVRNEIEKILVQGTNYDSEYRLFRSDRSMIWIASRGRLERDAQGRPFRMTGICIDITDRKKMEEQLLQSQKMEALGTLAGGIAHDFNNILLAIGGNASLAIEEVPPDHPAQVSLREIAKAGGRASALVRQILSFSRRHQPDRKRIPVQPIVEEALALLRSTLPARIEIRLDFVPDTPAILADSTQLHQVIMNLCTNAARAIGDQNGMIEISVRPFTATADFAVSALRLRPGQYVRISVRDTGIGMDPATLERIFDPFFTTQAPGQGTGLGLSVVHGIMKDHDGAVSVYSEPGKGSVFHLYFPAAPAPAAQPVQPVPATPRGHGEHLLYVDDEEALVMLASRSLGKLGYKVTGHSNPTRALQVFGENPYQFAAVITDLSMPGMSGADLARRVIEIRPDIPVVMTSGYLRPEDEEEAREIGVRELILKPDTIEELAKALHRVFMNTPVAPDSRTN